MSTAVIANGDQGTSLEGLPALFLRLRDNILDPASEKFGGFVSEEIRGRAVPDVGSTRPLRFSGGFFDCRHPFNVVTDDPRLIQLLTDAIQANQAKPAYQTAKRLREPLELPPRPIFAPY
jgi:hypothetical protein